MVTNSPTLEAPAAATPAGLPTQPTAPESKPEAGAKPEGKAQAEKPASINTPENAEKLRLILRREKEDPNVTFTSAELDLYDAYTDGKLKPAKRQTAPKDPEGKKVEDKPVISEPKADDAEEADDTALDAEDADEIDTDADDEDDEPAKPDPVLDALMKEVGAKKPEEILAKVKSLRSALGGKDAQEVAKLSKQVQNEQALWQDVAKGVPAAVAHAERVYGIKLAGSAPAAPAQAPNAPAKPAGQQGGRTYISEDAFIEPESAKMVNDILRQRDAEIDELRESAKSFNEERERNRRDTAMSSAKMAVVDEMVTVAQRMDPLKAIPNLREAIAEWYDKGKPDSRLEVFNELFEIAQKEGCNLTAAATIKRGLEADRLVAEAEERGRKAAYGHKPNPSLSGSQGGRNEQGNYSPLSNDQIEAMAEDHRLMPADWFDKDERPVKTKIPKKAWGLFGFTS